MVGAIKVVPRLAAQSLTRYHSGPILMMAGDSFFDLLDIKPFPRDRLNRKRFELTPDKAKMIIRAIRGGTLTPQAIEIAGFSLTAYNRWRRNLQKLRAQDPPVGSYDYQMLHYLDSVMFGITNAEKLASDKFLDRIEASTFVTSSDEQREQFETVNLPMTNARTGEVIRDNGRIVRGIYYKKIKSKAVRQSPGDWRAALAMYELMMPQYTTKARLAELDVVAASETEGEDGPVSAEHATFSKLLGVMEKIQKNDQRNVEANEQKIAQEALESGVLNAETLAGVQ